MQEATMAHHNRVSHLANQEQNNGRVTMQSLQAQAQTVRPMQAKMGRTAQLAKVMDLQTAQSDCASSSTSISQVEPQRLNVVINGILRLLRHHGRQLLMFQGLQPLRHSARMRNRRRALDMRCLPHLQLL
jgi:hypothetical protein